MNDWIQRLDSIIQLNGKELLSHAGEISHEMAVERSAIVYDTYKDELKKLEREQSLQELEDDIKNLKPSENRKN